MRLPFPVHEGRLFPVQGVGQRCCSSGLPCRELRPRWGSLLAHTWLALCCTWIQPGSLGATFRASCPALTATCTDRPGYPAVPSAPAHSPRPAHASQDKSVPLPGAPSWHLGPAAPSCLPLLQLPPQGLPRRLFVELACPGMDSAHGDWWLGLGAGVFFRCLLD